MIRNLTKQKEFMTDKEYVKDSGQYFSGQGIVSLETDDKIYDLGNCTHLIFYNNGTFRVVWEKLYKNTIELLLGYSEGKTSFSTRHSLAPKEFEHFKIKKNFGKEYILRFEGVNTADSNRLVVAQAKVKIKLAEFLSLINDELAHMVTEGVWEDDFDLYLAVVGQTDIMPKTRERIPIQDYPKSLAQIVKRGSKLVGVSYAEKVKEVWGVSNKYFNPSHIESLEEIKAQNGDELIEATKVIMSSGDFFVVLMSLAELQANIHAIESQRKSRKKDEKLMGKIKFAQAAYLETKPEVTTRIVNRM